MPGGVGKTQAPNPAAGTYDGRSLREADRALVVAYCKDSADPGRALEEVVIDEHLREMIVGPRGETKPQSLLEEGLQLLGDASVVKTMTVHVRAILAKEGSVVSRGGLSASAGRGGGLPKVSAPAGTTSSDETPRNGGRREAAERLERMVLALRAMERERETQSYLDRRQRGSSWLAKSYRVVNSNDIESRFIFSWIALNALFGAPRDAA